MYSYIFIYDTQRPLEIWNFLHVVQVLEIINPLVCIYVDNIYIIAS